MKKLICCVLALLLCLGTAFAEGMDILEIDIIETAPVATPEPVESPKPISPALRAAEGLQVAFEDGFQLNLPLDWLAYEVDGDAAEMGVMYALSDADAAHWLYIQRWNTNCANLSALNRLIKNAAQPKRSSFHAFNGTNFIVYEPAEGDATCCATMLEGVVLNFVFMPQSDMDFMATAVKIISTYKPI